MDLIVERMFNATSAFTVKCAEYGEQVHTAVLSIKDVGLTRKVHMLASYGVCPSAHCLHSFDVTRHCSFHRDVTLK